MYNKGRQELQTPHNWLLLFLLNLFEHFPAILRLSCPRDLDSHLHGSYPPVGNRFSGHSRNVYHWPTLIQEGYPFPETKVLNFCLYRCQACYVLLLFFSLNYCKKL